MRHLNACIYDLSLYHFADLPQPALEFSGRSFARLLLVLVNSSSGKIYFAISKLSDLVDSRLLFVLDVMTDLPAKFFKECRCVVNRIVPEFRATGISCCFVLASNLERKVCKYSVSILALLDSANLLK